MKPRINIITLGTSNLVKATEFYQNGLSFPKMEFDGDISFFELNGSWLALYPWELLAKDALFEDNNYNNGFRGITLAHNVESENEVVDILEQVNDAGATIIKSPQKTDWGGFHGYFADLDGHLWEIAYNPYFWPGPKDRPSRKLGLLKGKISISDDFDDELPDDIMGDYR